MIVPFGKCFPSFEACISLPLSYLYFFPFYCKLFSIVLKRKKKNKHCFRGKRSKFESGLFYMITLWVTASDFVTVTLRFLSSKMG